MATKLYEFQDEFLIDTFWMNLTIFGKTEPIGIV